MKNHPTKAITLALLVTYFISAASGHSELTDEQKKRAIEADTTDPKLTKIILLAGSTSNKPGQHEYFAGCTILFDCLRQMPGIWPVLVPDGWPKDEAIFHNAKAVVVYADGGNKLPFLSDERWGVMKKVVSSQAGLVFLHQSVDVPEDRATEIKEWIGGVWQKDVGCRGHWDMEFSQFPEHPILRGVSSFAAPLDGWLYNLHFAADALPILRGAVPDKSRSTADAKTHKDREEVIAWSYTRADGGRSFAFTGCDLHRNWGIENQRRLVTNGILWSAKVEVLPDGSPVSMQPGALGAHLDSKPAPKLQ